MTDRTPRPESTRRRWTAQEDAIVRELYGRARLGTIADHLDRTEGAVWVRATQIFKVRKRQEVRPWKDDELAELCRRYHAEGPAGLARDLDRPMSVIYRQARAMGVFGKKGVGARSAVGDYFDVIDTKGKAYVLGLMASDGCVSDSGSIHFGLQAKDADLVRFVRDQLIPHATLRVASRDEFVDFSATSRAMAAGLARWGVVPRKSCTLPWPADLGPMLRPFLLGYFDGDGSACIARGSNPANEYPNWSVCSGSEQFLIDMKEYICRSTGVVMEKIHHRPKSSLYQVMTTGRGAYVIDKWLHQEDLGLTRKRHPAHTTARYEAPPPPTPAEKLAAAIKAGGSQGITRKNVMVKVFCGSKTKEELDALAAEILAQPGFRTARRKTIGKASALFYVFGDEDREATQEV
jgi:hypothetical protein